ncbi:hypothetical protein FAB82_11500 [Glycomyces buryatensis]|uniref:Uncharacterized protein n=1 Tax=Glycomyces buryatensis TaxID=2570927 RepID=A0A4S8QAJ2_9ACTN|nr:hypothetical protein FAB82_11500 [Glycomyces buryatensis]
MPERLEYLIGPTSGVIELPRHLDWSGRPQYDLGQPGRIMDLYRTVIAEATRPTDLYSFLDARTLLELWPRMWIPAHIRQAWEHAFPELLRARLGHKP